ncbi:MAG: hypothetical protein EA363_07295 [Balneolaceae bacterium]|nr:MAG: hypothetical protein EA363_07295 [Balneolaceae bacterium]
MKYISHSIILLILLFSGCLETQPIFDNEADIEFLEEYAQRDDVILTDSGLMYRVLQQGEGESPVMTSQVRVHYEATLVTGEVIGSSYDEDEPLVFSLQEVITGFSEGLTLMQEGAEYELVIPPELGYGDFPPDSRIHPGAVLIFQVELLEIIQDEEEETDDPAASIIPFDFQP